MSRSLPANVIAAGNPARVIKPLPDGEGTTRSDLFNMDIPYAQFADDFMRERLRGNGFLSWLGSFLFHGVLINVFPVTAVQRKGANALLKAGHVAFVRYSSNSKVTIQQRNTTVLPTVRRFSLNLLVWLISADGIFRQWFWQRR